MGQSTYSPTYEVEKKPKFVEYNEKKFAAAPFPRFPIVSGSKIPYPKPYRPSDAKLQASPNVGNENSEVKQYTKAIMDNRRRQTCVINVERNGLPSIRMYERCEILVQPSLA